VWYQSTDELVLNQEIFLQVGVEGGVDSAQMKRLDKYGFDMRVSKGNDSGILRIPFGEFSSHTSRQRYRLVFPTSLSYSQPSPPMRSIYLFRAISPALHAPARSGSEERVWRPCAMLFRMLIPQISTKLS